MSRLRWVNNDGGRAAAGYRGTTNDCVCRSIAIATAQPYQTVYDALNELSLTERMGRMGRVKRGRSSARTGVYRPTIHAYLSRLGWSWRPTMGVGTGCRVHLRSDELPADRSLIISCSKHLTAMIQGVIHDTHDPSRGGTRCVYGYWEQLPQPSVSPSAERGELPK